MRGPCVKQRVIATIIATCGEEFVGENDCDNAQSVCPRAGMASGVGYHLCREVCRQGSHAEIAALKKAGPKARGATLHLRGHTYVCDDCQAALDAAGVAKTVIGTASSAEQGRAS